MSATSGTLENPLRFSFLRISPNARASAILGAVMRTISHPASIMRMDWATVASTSVVGVVVMDWRRMGLSPPTPTWPTMTVRVFRRLYWKRSGTNTDGLEDMAAGVDIDDNYIKLAKAPGESPGSWRPIAGAGGLL